MEQCHLGDRPLNDNLVLTIVASLGAEAATVDVGALLVVGEVDAGVKLGKSSSP